MPCTATHCEYNRICVPSVGPVPARLATVTEAPGYRELENMKPLVGPAGRLYDSLLVRAGISRADVRIINTCGCVDMEREDRRPLPAEIEACRPRLLADLEQVSSILAMGNISLLLFFPGMTVSKARGSTRAWRHPTTGKVIPVTATYHPAYALPMRSPQVQPLIVEDIKTALSMIGEPWNL